MRPLILHWPFFLKFFEPGNLKKPSIILQSEHQITAIENFELEKVSLLGVHSRQISITLQFVGNSKEIRF